MSRRRHNNSEFNEINQSRSGSSTAIWTRSLERTAFSSLSDHHYEWSLQQYWYNQKSMPVMSWIPALFSSNKVWIGNTICQITDRKLCTVIVESAQLSYYRKISWCCFLVHCEDSMVLWSFHRMTLMSPILSFIILHITQSTEKIIGILNIKERNR